MLTIIGLVGIYGGIGALVYGTFKNYDAVEKITSLIQSGNWTPGNKWILAGIIVIAISSLLILINAKWKTKPKKTKYY